MAKRIKIGDILQILTSEGVCYAQVTHKHPEFGFLIRVFAGFHDKAPRDFQELTQSPVQFSAFFVAQSAVNQGLLSVVANNPVPAHLADFPVFRSRNGGPGGSIWLWDGESSERLERRLTPDEMKYSVRGIISAPLLVERIEQGYTPEVHEIW